MVQDIWFIISMVLLICIIILIVYIFMYKNNIKRITRDFENIIGKDTNQILTVSSSQKDIVILVNKINALIKESRMSVISIKRLNKNFRESITSISHDLRTPLTTARGYVQMLRDDTLTNDEKKEYIDIVEERQETVKVLLEQLFEYARIEAGEVALNIEKININEILSDCLSMYYNDFVNKNQEPIITGIEKKYIINGDANAVKRIFSNIIYNGLIHGEKNYKFECIEKDNAYEYIFSNSSEYLDEDELTNIFDRFYTKDKSRTKKSTGLGLSIARQLVNKMNGKISASYSDECIHIKICFPKI